MNNIVNMQNERHWLGEVRGTHIGNAFLEVKEQSVNLSVNINGDISTFKGSINDGPPVVFNIASINTPDVTGVIIFDAVLPDGFNSTWRLSDGSAGFARWHTAPTSSPSIQPTNTSPLQPSQIVATDNIVGSITLYKSDLDAILEHLRNIFDNRIDPIITASIDNHRTTQFASDFLKRKDIPSFIHNCTIGIYDNSTPHPRNVIINLKKNDNNNVTVSSYDEIWTSGTTQRVVDVLSRYTSAGTAL